MPFLKQKSHDSERKQMDSRKIQFVPISPYLFWGFELILDDIGGNESMWSRRGSGCSFVRRSEAQAKEDGSFVGRLEFCEEDGNSVSLVERLEICRELGSGSSLVGRLELCGEADAEPLGGLHEPLFKLREDETLFGLRDPR